MELTTAQIEELKGLGVATVYEASGLPCILDPAIKPVWSGARVCGPALTVRCHPGDNLAIHRALADVSAGYVLLVQAEGHIGGYWGEILAVAAQVRQVSGLVIDGDVRDSEALQARGFPAFARGVGVHRTTKHEPGDVGGQITVGGVTANTGDLVIGDADGVLVLPAAAVQTVLEASRKRMANEALTFERLHKGEVTLDIFGLRGKV